MPFIHQIWILIPKDTTILDLYFFQIDHLGYGDFVSAMYYLIAKITYMIPLVFWFFIEKNWWRYALLSPITVYIFQTKNILDTSQLYVDELELYQSSFFLAAFAILLVFLTKAAYRQNYIASIYQNLRSHFEKKMEVRYEQKELQLRSKRKYLKQMVQKGKHANLEELQKLKGELEEQLASF